MIDRLICEDPGRYVAIVASIVRVARIEIGQPGEYERARTREEVLQRLEERAGPEGRKLLEHFLRQLEALEAASNDSTAIRSL